MKIPDILKVKRISTKFALAFLLSGLLIICIISVIGINKNKRFSREHQVYSSKTLGKYIATIVQSKVEDALTTAKTTSLMFSHTRNSKDSLKVTREESLNVLRQVLQTNKNFYALGMFWEPNSFDGDDKNFSNKNGFDASGCFNAYWFVNRESKYEWIPRSGHILLDYYKNAKLNKQPLLVEPHRLHSAKNEMLVSTVVYPIVYQNKFYGVTVIDLALNELTKSIDTDDWSINNLEIIAQKGTIIENIANPNLVGESLKDFSQDFESEIDKIEREVSEITETDDEIIVHTPVPLQGINSRWQIRVSISKDKIFINSAKSVGYTLSFSVLLLCVACYLIFRYTNRLFKPLKVLSDTASSFSIKDLKLDDIKVTGEEIVSIYKAYKILVDSINKTTEFADHIGKGNLDIDFQPINSKDILGKALLQMRERLKSAKDSELERKEIEQKQNWITEGIAKFNEILRQQSNDLEDLGFRIIKKLVTYINANQGAIFVVNNDNPEDIYLEIIATVAYDEKKYLKKKIELGEGLVGMCALEKKTIYQTKLPNDYINITSGLGSANPRHLLIVPLLINDEVMGIIEVASFAPIEKYVIQLLEELAESLAATLATSKINEKTTKLLQLSQEQALKMDAQKKIMEKSFTKFDQAKKKHQSLQAEMEQLRKLAEYDNIFVEFDKEERLVAFNENFTAKTGISKNEMSFFELRNLVSPTNFNQYKHIKDMINQGCMIHEVVQLYNKDNRHLLVNAVFAPIVIDGEITKIYLLAQENQ